MKEWPMLIEVFACQKAFIKQTNKQKEVSACSLSLCFVLRADLRAGCVRATNGFLEALVACNCLLPPASWCHSAVATLWCMWASRECRNEPNVCLTLKPFFFFSCSKFKTWLKVLIWGSGSGLERERRERTDCPMGWEKSELKSCPLGFGLVVRLGS